MGIFIGVIALLTSLTWGGIALDNANIDHSCGGKGETTDAPGWPQNIPTHQYSHYGCYAYHVQLAGTDARSLNIYTDFAPSTDKNGVTCIDGPALYRVGRKKDLPLPKGICFSYDTIKVDAQ